MAAAGRSSGVARPSTTFSPWRSDGVEPTRHARSMTGLLIAFEGLDQSGKQTQAEGVVEFVRTRRRACRLVSFPDYTTAIGSEISRALHGEREYGPDVMQLMYVANRYERRPEMAAWLEEGTVLVCDRYLASSIAYGEAQGLDAGWLRDMQRYLKGPDLTILLDIAPETAVQRKAQGRDRYERDLALLSRVRESYRRQAAEDGWLTLNGERTRDDVSRDVVSAIETLLARP
jgi:dTMP kinase